ncbi:hypothetical protein AB0C02_13335 [Micromonospora sp. NPDC048999]|uniref:hypothetical protein n=1 Tax=Micromonospora sp. NPDC048999 TaxID=3155391 RepID=UPI0033CAF2B7
MRQARRQRLAQRREARALHWSRAGRHAWAIHLANEAVALRRPIAEQHPAAMARALAVRAVCLHVRGRTAEAARDVDECLAYLLGQVDDVAGTADVASLLGQAGHTDEAMALVERLLADAETLPRPRPPAPLLVYGELLLRRGRAEDARAALREAYAAAEGSGLRLRASGLLFEALAAAGRLDELEEHAFRDLWLFAVNAWGNVPGRLRYIHLLELLARQDLVSDRLPPMAMAIAKQYRKLLRQQRRRWILVAARAVLTGRLRGLPERPRAAGPLDAGRAAVLAHLARAEADIERCRESGDARALSEAWGALARARWQAGGQRSAALEAQRTALAATRRWAEEDPDKARPALVRHLRRFAEFAGTVGLHSDAQLARAEAEQLDGVGG